MKQGDRMVHVMLTIVIEYHVNVVTFQSVASAILCALNCCCTLGTDHVAWEPFEFLSLCFDIRVVEPAPA